MDLVLKNREKIVSENGENEAKIVDGIRISFVGRKKSPNLLTFSHEPYRKCCDQEKSNPTALDHTKSFGLMLNSDQGWMKYHNLEEWGSIVKLPHTWGDSTILQLISCFTGLTFHTHNYKCGKIHPLYNSYVSVTSYGFPKPIHGGKILLSYRQGCGA